MVELNRLKPMVDNYDKKLFNQIFKETEQLRKKLAYNIDHRRMGIENQDVVAFFNIKFVYTFNKYYPEFKDDPGVLKGHIIRALQLFSNRLLKVIYSKKNEVNNSVELTQAAEFSIEYEDEEIDQATLKKLAMKFLKSQLSPQAYMVLTVDINPPMYVLTHLGDKKRVPDKIPNELVADYLGFDNTEIVQKCRKEITNKIRQARQHFCNITL